MKIILAIIPTQYFYIQNFSLTTYDFNEWIIYRLLNDVKIRKKVFAINWGFNNFKIQTIEDFYIKIMQCRNIIMTR